MSDWITWNAPYTGWAVMLLLAVFGTAVAVLGSRRRPSRTADGHCGRCGYDLRGSPGDRCSECGTDVGSNAPRLPRRWRWVNAGVVLAIGLPAAVVAKRVNEYGLVYYTYVGPLYWVLPDEVIEELSHGGYVVRLSRDRYPDSTRERTLTISHHGRRVYERHGWYFTLGLCDADIPLGPIADLDGDGTDELIVQQSDGGNGGRHNTIICSLAEEPAQRKLLVIPKNLVINGSKPDSTHGRLLLAQVPFYFLGYGHSVWKGVVLRYDDGHVSFVPEAMRGDSGYSSSELSAIAERKRQSQKFGVKLAASEEFEIANAMLDLIFTGHTPEAYEFLDQIWASDVPAKREFVVHLRRLLSDSPARDALMALGHPPLDPPTPRETIDRYGN